MLRGPYFLFFRPSSISLVLDQISLSHSLFYAGRPPFDVISTRVIPPDVLPRISRSILLSDTEGSKCSPNGSPDKTSFLSLFDFEQRHRVGLHSLGRSVVHG